MRTILSIFSALLVFLSISTEPVLAYFLDAPHNEANGILCSYCHSHPVWSGTFVPQNIDNTEWNSVCNDCHSVGGANVQETLHSDLKINGTENWTTQCIDCHNPHFQDQFRAYGNTFSQMYLVDGQLLSGSPIVDNDDGTTTIQYITISLPLAPWDNPATWGSKGGFTDGSTASDGSRGLIFATLDPTNAQLYEVISATDTNNGDSGQLEGTITLKGHTTYQGDVGLLPNAHFGLIYGGLIKSELNNANTKGQGTREVKFFSPVANPTGPGGFVDKTPGATAPEGICQVCHIPLHGIDEDCDNCHGNHANGFGGEDILQEHSAPFLTDNNRGTVAAAIRQIFTATDRAEADQKLKDFVLRYEKTAPRLAEWAEANIPEGLTVFRLPPEHHKRMRTSNSIERLNKEIKRRTKVATLFPNEESLLRLVSAVLAEISEDWETGKVYLSMENG